MQGYSSKVEVVVAVDEAIEDGLDGATIQAIKVVKQLETPGLGSNCTRPEFQQQFTALPCAMLRLAKGVPFRKPDDPEGADLAAQALAARLAEAGRERSVALLERRLGEALDGLDSVDRQLIRADLARLFEQRVFLPERSVRFNRRNIFARDGNRCQYCGRRLPSPQLSLDHVIPRSRGGRTTWDNVVCACLRCNVKKGGRTPREARMMLIRKPVRPKRSPLLLLKLNNPKYQSWKTWLDGAHWEVGV